MIRALIIALLLPLSALAQEEHVVGALSQNTVSINANFNGSEIWVFGAVRRNSPVAPGKGPLDVVIMIKGPDERVTVRRKEHVLGIWINRDSVEVDVVPSFYTIATTAPLNEIMNETARRRYRIGFDHAVRLIGARSVSDPQAFTQAAVRIRQAEGLYSQQDGTIQLDQETLFRTQISLPANLVEGTYEARMFLLRDGDVVNAAWSTIEVRKDGLERLIYVTAHERPLLYGVISILVALFAGWFASAIFTIFRR